ncbi:hypothetical protein FOC1_g10010441 [Fusarium oxysporum f. sp. cubense race 1]|uniref:Uncharacterized protein n=1 Tax=Fusarium oxysporum f. sp. cubense (strain race 1) TaxID=1229664 RepID=N4UY60_FUSC1|nr:hypothetical protein FOC1_g10010441 [Fusarium oxysporum f. sp. cubense race 1]
MVHRWPQHSGHRCTLLVLVSNSDEANGCTSFWFWEQVLAEFPWCHSLVIREWRVGRASTDIIMPTVYPAHPLEAQTGLKVRIFSCTSRRDTHMGEGLKFSFTLVVHHVASTSCAKTFFPSNHQVQEARLISPHRTYSKAVTKYSSIQWPSIISTLF